MMKMLESDLAKKKRPVRTSDYFLVIIAIASP